MSYYAKNPHYAPDDFSEENEKLERCEREAGTWFNQATKPQRAAYDLAIADLRGLMGPRYTRARETAQAAWYAATRPAAALFDLTVAELLTTGEVSEELQYRWEMLAVADVMMQAAE